MFASARLPMTIKLACRARSDIYLVIFDGTLLFMLPPRLPESHCTIHSSGKLQYEGSVVTQYPYNYCQASKGVETGLALATPYWMRRVRCEGRATDGLLIIRRSMQTDTAIPLRTLPIRI